MPFAMSTAQEQIKELERQIENLRNRAVLELKVKLAEARNHVVDLESKIAELTDSAAPAKPDEPKKVRVSITIKQIVEAIQGGATNYRAVANALGCSPANVAQKIKAEGKKAGIRSRGEKANFVLSVK
jgi:chromosome segregation ATPase